VAGEYVGCRSRTLSADGRIRAALPGVCSAAFSPDGAILATGGDIPSLCFWDTVTGKQIDETKYDQESIRYLRFTPDGKQVLSAGFEPRLWDVATQKVVRTFPTPETKETWGKVWTAALSADGKTVAAANVRAQYIWNAADGKLLRAIPQENWAGAGHITFSADAGTLIANPRVGESLGRWDVTTGKPLGAPPKEEGQRRARTVGFSADGRFLAWTTDDINPGHARGWGRTLFVADVAGEKEILRRKVEPPASFLLSADGKTLAVAEGNGAMVLLDTMTGKLLHTCVEAPQPVLGLCYREQGKRLLSLGADGTLHDWGTKDGAERRRLRIPPAAKEFPHRLSPDGKLLALADANGGLRVWDLEAGRERWREEKVLAIHEPLLSLKPWANDAPLPPPRVVLEFSPDGRMLLGACGSDAKQVTAWDAASGVKRRQLTSSAFQAVTLSPDEKSLIACVAEEQGCAVRVWDMASGNQTRRVPLKPVPGRSDGEAKKTEVTDLLVSPGGKMVAVVEEVVTYLYPNRMRFNGADVAERRIHLWERKGGNEPRVLTTSGCRALAFSPDGNRLAYAEAPFALAIFDIPGGKVHKTRGLEQPDVTALLFSPDGKTLASASSDGTILLWDVAKVLQEPPQP
jgi:WD40 repeat protein